MTGTGGGKHRPLRILHVGNIAQNGYINASILRARGHDCDLVAPDELLADCVEARSQREAHVRVDVAVEALELREKCASGKWLSRMPTESLGSKATGRSPPTASMAAMWRG